MNIDLTGKTAVVSGSTAGIGFAVAKQLAAAGAEVLVNGRREGAVNDALARLREAVPGARVQGVAADLATAAGCMDLIAKVPAADILVNNVGIYEQRDFFEIGDEDWLHYFELNVMSGVRLSRHYIPRMVQQGWGRIVFLSSESGLNIPPDMLHYGVTKTACLALSRGLAKRLAGTGVTVNAVLPGPTLSEGVAEMLKADAAKKGQSLEEAGRDFVKSQRPSSIIQRVASTEEVANMIVYACSREASATTGAALRVDGGVVDSIA